MRVSPLRLGLLAASLLAVSACDSGGSSSGSTPGALVGTWSLRETTITTFLTSSESQAFVNTSGATTGSVALSGSVTATLQYIQSVPSPGQYGDAVLTSYDPRAGYSPSALNYQLSLGANGASRLYVLSPSGTSSEYYSYGSAPAFTYTEGRLMVRAVTLESSYGATGTVAVGAGTVAFPTIQLPAGQRTQISSATVPFDSDPYSGFEALRYILKDGGAYRAERDYSPNVTRSVSGTWEAGDALLRLSVTDASGSYTETETFQYVVGGGRLQLSVASSPCRASTGCLGNLEFQYGLRPGTLVAYTAETATVFTSADGRADRPSAASTREASTSVRREASVWPRVLARPVAAGS